MKKIIVLFGLLFVLPCFAEVAPAYFDDAGNQYSVDESGNMIDESGNVFQLDNSGNLVQINDSGSDVTPDTATVSKARTTTNLKKSTTQRATTGRVASRAVPSSVSTASNQRTISERPVSNRSTSSTANTTTRNSGKTVSRASNQNSGNLTTRRNTSVARTATGTDSTGTYIDYSSDNTSVARAASTSDPVSTARVGVRTSSALSRTGGIRAATATPVIDTTDVISSTTAADALMQMTDFCKAQYTECMDQYCNVLDENQGRCSCSANISNYSKTETALKNATAELQTVAQKIQYIGLTGDEVESLFTETEAEEAMKGKTDTTQLKNDLDNIKDLIIDVKTASSSSSSSGFDLSSLMDFDFGSSGFDLSSFLGNNTSSISNQRGEKLYATATARCKTSVLDSCTAKGVDAAVITNSYDLEIDKQCLSYEKELVSANDEMTSTVANAKVVLQKARLVVAQSKNAYDLKGCITALDECMQDEFVCGEDYEGCLDPTGKYIVNGAVVVGGEPGVSGGDIDSTTTAASVSGLYSVWNYDTYNTFGNGDINGFISAYIADEEPDATKMIGYLQQKIGYHDNTDGRDYGMCVSVLNKCKNISYDENDEYQRDNKVVENYLQRTLTQVKAKQDEVLADYAEDCVSDVSTCLSNNNYDEDSSLSMTAAKKSCSTIIRTCSSVTGNDADYVVSSAVGSSTTVYPIKYLQVDGVTPIVWQTGQTPTLYYDTNLTITLPLSTQILTSGCTSGLDQWEFIEGGGEGMSFGSAITPTQRTYLGVTSGSITFKINCL